MCKGESVFPTSIRQDVRPIGEFMAATRHHTGADPAFAKQILGYSLTTAEILYRLPDHPGLLQTYVWQDFDVHPRFPKLNAFLAFWHRICTDLCIACGSLTMAS